MKPTIKQIIEATASVCGVGADDLTGYRRTQPLVWYRILGYYVCVYRLGASMSLTAHAFNRHHTTVIKGLQAHREAIASDPMMSAIWAKAQAIARQQAGGVFFTTQNVPVFSTTRDKSIFLIDRATSRR